MNGPKSQKEKQIHDINEVLTEIREAYFKIKEKIYHLKETTYKDAVEKFSQEAESIFETLNQAGHDLQNKSLKEIEAIKNNVLIQFDKASNLQHELKRMSTKEAFVRQMISDEMSVLYEGSASKMLDKSVVSDLDNTFVKTKVSPNQNFWDSPQPEIQKNEGEGHRRFKPSYCTSDFSDKIIHEFYENSDDQENPSFEDYKAYRNTIKNKRMSKKTSQSVQFASGFASEFLKEPSDYEMILSKKAKMNNTKKLVPSTKEQSYLEGIWNLHRTFGKIASPKKSAEAPQLSEQGFFFKNSKELLELLEKNHLNENPRDYLWQYISFLQDRIQTDAEYYQRGLSQLKEELAHKDETIKQLLKKQEKHDINAETKYYDNLKLVHNPQKMISQIKSARYTNQNMNYDSYTQNENISKDSAKNRLKCMTARQNYDSGPGSAYGSVTNRSVSNFDPYFKGPLNSISTNQSYDFHNIENHLNSKTHRNQHEAYYSTANSYGSLNTLQGEDDLVFSNNMNVKAYIQNLQETLTVMKENSVLVQSENCKLKEYVKLLRNKVNMLEREKDENVLKKSMTSQPNSYRNYTQMPETSKSMQFKWVNPNKVLGLEQKHKAALNSYRYNKSISYAPQETES